MATTRLMPLHAGKGKTVGNAISDVIDYVKNPEKTGHGTLISCWECDSRIADAEFLYTKQDYIRKTGKTRGADDIIAYHLRQSFLPGEITPEEAKNDTYDFVLITNESSSHLVTFLKNFITIDIAKIKTI